MSQEEQAIQCRNCHEEIPLSVGNCPHCGTSIRSDSKLIVVLLFGIVLAAISLFNLSSLLIFGVIGVVIAGVAGVLLYDKRSRMGNVIETEEGVFGESE